MFSPKPGSQRQFADVQAAACEAVAQAQEGQTKGQPPWQARLAVHPRNVVLYMPASWHFLYACLQEA
eukprot:9263280-Karenia_brevis.AAC.1